MDQQGSPRQRWQRVQRSEVTSVGAARIIQAAVRKDVSIEELGKLAQNDPAFALRLLSTVNSAAYQGVQSVSDLAQAVALLGIRGTRTVALSLVVADLAPLGEGGTMLLGNCIRRATAARLLGEALGDDKSDDYFTAGLLLDAGLLRAGKEMIAEAVEVARSPAFDRLLRERALGRQGHPSLGADIAAEYSLPADTVQAIAQHHDPNIPQGTLAAVAWTAERMAGVFEGGSLEANRERALAAASQLGLSAEKTEEVLHKIPSHVEEASLVFSRDLGKQHDVEELRDNAQLGLVEMLREYETLVRRLEAVVEEKERLAERLQQANESLTVLAATDALTELPNRRSFQESFMRDIARAIRSRQPLGLVVLDIDHFKQFNDQYGHATGDEVLQVVARALRVSLRESDIAARFGGEEFALILPGAGTKDASKVAERVRECVAKAEARSAQGNLKVTISLGVACLDEPFTEPAESLFERADTALYRAKEAGRNCVKVSKRR